jgi:hypothetical protein
METIWCRCRRCGTQYQYAPNVDPAEARSYCSPDCTYPPTYASGEVSVASVFPEAADRLDDLAASEGEGEPREHAPDCGCDECCS